MRWNKYEYNNVYNNEAIRANEINVNKDQDPYPISAFLLLIPSNLGLCYIHWNIFSHQCFVRVCVRDIRMKNINLPSPCISITEGSSSSSVLLAKVHLSLWWVTHVSFHRTFTFIYCLFLIWDRKLALLGANVDHFLFHILESWLLRSSAGWSIV